MPGGLDLQNSDQNVVALSQVSSGARLLPKMHCSASRRNRIGTLLPSGVIAGNRIPLMVTASFLRAHVFYAVGCLDEPCERFFSCCLVGQSSERKLVVASVNRRSRTAYCRLVAV
jgi:hypothetical protein